MRTAALLIAAAAAFTLSACNKPAEDTTDASTEAAEASGAAADTAMTAEGSAAEAASAANAGGSRSGSGSGANAGGQTMAPASGSTVSDGAMAPAAQPPVGAGTTVTETERRLNPPQNSQPAQ